jgi:hypothetical protein
VTAVLKALATDGGDQHYEEDLAEETGYSVSTIYRALQAVSDQVVNDNGLVRFYSEKIRQEIQGIADMVEDVLGDGVEAVARLANVETRSSADSAFQRWMDKYGVSLEEISEEGGKIRFDTVMSTLASSDVPTLEDVLQEGLDAWTRTGRDASVFARLRYEVKNLDGTRGVRGRVKPRITR